MPFSSPFPTFWEKKRQQRTTLQTIEKNVKSVGGAEKRYAFMHSSPGILPFLKQKKRREKSRRFLILLIQ